MKLKLLKINDRTFYFKKTINIFLGEKNSGKTTIFQLLKFIYGAEYSSKKNLHKALIKIAKQNKDFNITWEFENDETEYTLNLFSEKVKLSSGLELAISKYSQHINSKFRFYNSVFNVNIKSVECFSFDEDMAPKLNSNSDYAKFFYPQKDMSYTSLCFLKLIQKDSIASVMQDYLKIYGKKKNLDKIVSATNDIKNEIPMDLLNALSDSKQNIVQRYVGLNKIYRRDYDEDFFIELEEICKNIDNFDISKVKEFHDYLIESYNDVIEDERRKMKEEDEILNLYTRDEFNSAITYNNLNHNVKEEINLIKPELKEKSITLNSYETVLNDISNDIQRFCEEFNKTFNVIKTFNNKLEFRELNGVISNLVLNLQNSSLDTLNAGGSDTVTNFIGFLTYTLIHSRFPVMLFEKTFLSENQNSTIIEILIKISKCVNDSKQVFLTLHPDEELKRIDILNKSIELFECENNFFGITF